MKHPHLVVAVLATFVWVTTAHAAPSWKDRRQAQKLNLQATWAMKKGDHEAAADKWRQADELNPAPSYKLGRARALLKQEAFLEAAEVLAGCAAAKPRQWAEKVAVKKCTDLVAEVDKDTPSLEVTVFEPSSEQVTLIVAGEPYDPAEGPRALDPGPIDVAASAEGYEPFTETVTLVKGARESLEVTLAKAIVTPPPDEGAGLSPVWAYTTWGLGAVGLGVGIGFGVLAINATDDVLERYDCEDAVCPPEAEDDLADAKLKGNVSTAGFVIGIAGATAGTILYMLSDDGGEDEASIEARPLLGPGFIGVTGAF